MMTLIILLLSISLIILFINLIFTFLFPAFNKKPDFNQNYLNISIIIACKNEEKNLEDLFSSLKLLKYPEDKFEVILVDDHSTDNSYQKAIALSNGKTNYRILNAHDKKYPGKKGALSIGIDAARYPYIVITDADCMPAENWLMAYSEKFSDNIDLLFGLAPFIPTGRIINKISCFENLRSSILTVVSAKINLPYSAAARNLGFKKTSYENLGGFSRTMETISGDDDLLLREAVKEKMKIGIVDLADSFVLSTSKRTLKEYIDQKVRHTKTSFYYLPKHKFLLGFWHSSNILIIFSLIFMPMNFLVGLSFFIKLIGDTIIISLAQKKLKYHFKLYEIPFLQIIYEIFIIVNFFSSFRKIILWKN